MHPRPAGDDLAGHPVRITPWQLALLLVTTGAITLGTSVDSLLTVLARNGLWVSILVALPAVFAGVMVLLALARRHPQENLVQVLRRRLGLLAYPLGLAYAALFLVDAGLSGREFLSLSRLLFLATPATAFILPLVGLAVYGDLLGLEVVARVNSVLLLFVDLPLGLLLMFLAMGTQRTGRLLPALPRGLGPMLQGSQLFIGMFGYFVLLLVFLPLTSDRRRAERATLWAALLVVLTAGHNIGPILTFGEAAARFAWPSFKLVEVVKIGTFIENMDPAAILLWVHGFWLAISVTLEAAALTLAHLFGLRSERPLIAPLGAVVVLLIFVLAPGIKAEEQLRWNLDAFAFLVLGFGLPLLLLLISVVADALKRKRRRKTNEAPS